MPKLQQHRRSGHAHEIPGFVTAGLLNPLAIPPAAAPNSLPPNQWNNFVTTSDGLLSLRPPSTTLGGLNRHFHRIPRRYLVYRRVYKEHLRPIQEFHSQKRDFQVIDRYGAFKYSTQGHPILMGILAAENVIKNAGHDLWDVMDYDAFQEG